MPSRLSSLLVRDGVVTVKRMERAFQRQVLQGGALDTVLLEMKLVPIERLQQYLSLATGLPPANHREVEEIDPEAAARCPKEVAAEHRVVPISLDGEALRVLVCDPVDLDRLEALANELGCAIQPLVVPEFQFHVSFARIYGDGADDRFTRLAEVTDLAAALPVGRAPSVIVSDEASQPTSAPVEIEPEVTEPQAPPEERVRGKRPKPEQPERRVTMELSTDALRDHIAATEALAAGAPRIVATPSASQPEVVPLTSAVAQPRGEELEAIDAAGTEPLTIAEARRLLADAEDRDLVFRTLLRALRGRTRWAALFTVQRGAAVGRLALGDDFDRDAISEITVPLEPSSPFRQVVERRSFHIGAASSGDEQVDAQIAALGAGAAPAALFLLPLVIKERVIAIAAAHRFDEPFTIAEMSELLPIANAATDALSRLIVRAKAGRGATGEAAADAAPGKPAEGGASEPAENDARGDGSGAIDSLLAAAQSEDEATREAAIAEALERPAEVLPALQDAFPGRLEVDRKHSGDRPLPAAQHGPLLGLVVRMGGAAGELLAERMRDNDREIRYYATLCAAELRPKNALNELVERLFDGDREIRALAVGALVGYPPGELDEALDFARRSLHSEDMERFKAAAEGLSKIGDLGVIPDLLDAHSRGGDAAQAARKALLVLTKQDFGTSNRKWRSWWAKNEGKSRVEWMLEGLAHKSAEVRKSAADDLRALTGEYFGYHHDLPKKEREQARQRWQQWWTETGRHRFLRGADERDRSTGVLPQQSR